MTRQNVLEQNVKQKKRQTTKQKNIDGSVKTSQKTVITAEAITIGIKTLTHKIPMSI